MSDRDDDLSISNTDVVFDPCLVGFEDEIRRKRNGKHGGIRLGQTHILLAWDYPES